VKWHKFADGECRSVCGRAVIARRRYARGAGCYFTVRVDGVALTDTPDTLQEAKRIAAAHASRAV
jgi:hypothetical protein